MDQIKKQIIDWVDKDKTEIISFFSQLVQCKTPSEPGDTRSAADLIKKFLNTSNISYKDIRENELMPNLLALTTMETAGRHLMLNGHLDVMPAGHEPGWSDDPWSGKISCGKVFGRGSADMKCGVTASLFAFVYLTRLKASLKGKLSLTLVSDEETGYDRGTGFLFETHPDEVMCDCVLSGEPSGSETISYASKGYMQFTVVVRTRGAIAGYGCESASSIEVAMNIIHDLKSIEKIGVNVSETITGRSSELDALKKITVDITTIKGGDLISVIAPECSFTVAVVMPLMTDPYIVLKKAEEIVGMYKEATFMLDGFSPADFSSPEDEMVHVLQDVVVGLGKEKPQPVCDIAQSDCR